MAPVDRLLQRRHLAVHSKSRLLIIFDLIGPAFSNYLPLIGFVQCHWPQQHFSLFESASQ